MSDSPPAVRRRILWIVVLIVFMVALAILYTVLAPRHPVHRVGTADPNAVTHAR